MENIVGETSYYEWISFINSLLEFVSDLPFILMFIAFGYYCGKVIPQTLIQKEKIKKTILFLNKTPILKFFFVFIPILVITSIILMWTNYLARLGWGLVFYTSAIFYSFTFSLNQRLKTETKCTQNQHIIFLLIITLNFTGMYFKYRDATTEEITQCKSKFSKIELDDEHNTEYNMHIAVSLNEMFNKACIKSTPGKRFKLIIN